MVLLGERGDLNTYTNSHLGELGNTISKRRYPPIQNVQSSQPLYIIYINCIKADIFVHFLLFGLVA